MLDEAKKQLAGSIQKIKENSTLAANEVYDITRNRIEALETAHQEVRLFCSNVNSYHKCITR